MPMRSIIFCSLILASAPLAAGDLEARRTVSVTGEGTVLAVPDEATVTTGVETRAPDPREALTRNNEAVAALMKVLADAGVAERDVQTSGFNISPVYRHDREDTDGPRIEGYLVSNQLHVRVRELDKLGSLLSALVESGSNRMAGIGFGHSALAERTDEARRAAVADARRRAELYAEAAGVKVGRVLSINEAGSHPPPQPMLRNMAMMEFASADVPVAAGESEIRAMVQVVFELE